MDPNKDEIEELQDTVIQLKEMVKELRESNLKREAQVKKALEDRSKLLSERERQELDILMIVLIVALTVEIILFFIIMFKM
jgi:hypothetical protein